jgi:hypothetical protein
MILYPSKDNFVYSTNHDMKGNIILISKIVELFDECIGTCRFYALL